MQAFDMFASNPLEGNAYGGSPPANPSKHWKSLQNARQRIGLMLVAHAKAQPQALLPHVALVANKIQELWAAGFIGTNEQCTLYDVVLAAASIADVQLQKQVTAAAIADSLTKGGLLCVLQSPQTAVTCAAAPVCELLHVLLHPVADLIAMQHQQSLTPLLSRGCFTEFVCLQFKCCYCQSCNFQSFVPKICTCAEKTAAYASFRPCKHLHVQPMLLHSNHISS